MRKSLLLLFCIFNLTHLSAVTNKSTKPPAPEQILQGYVEKISGSDIKWNAMIPGSAPEAMIVRGVNGLLTMEWKSEAVPEKVNGKPLSFVWISGISGTAFGKQPIELTLYANNKKIAAFTTAGPKNWIAKGEKNCMLSFVEQSRDGSDDRYGYMKLTLPVKFVTPGKSVTFRFEASNVGQESWTMVFKGKVDLEKMERITAKSIPAILKGSNKQLIRLTCPNFGADQKISIQCEGQTINRTITLGNNNIEIPVEASKSVRKIPISVASADGKQELSVEVEPLNRKWQLNCVQHSHTDIGYTRAQHEILSEHIRYIDFALDYCDLTDSYPEDAKFRWTCEAAWAVDEFIRTRPQEQIDRFLKRIKEGRIEVTAMYFNYDELPDERTLAQSLKPLQEFKKLGIKVESAMQNDVNGIGWCFNEIYPELGVKYLTMGTHGHKALICFDKPTVFNWESPSGKKILAFRAEHYNLGNFLQIEKGAFEEFEFRTLNYLTELEKKNYPFDITSIQYSGYFTDNSPPSTSSSEMIRKWNEKYEWPKLRAATPSEFLSTVEKRYGDQLETIRGAWPDWWTDGFASGAREAAITRMAHTDITANQIGLSMAKIMGAKIPESERKKIEDTDNALLFYGEHTFGYAGSVSDPFGLNTMEQRSHKAAYAWESYRRSRSVGETALGLLQSYSRRDPKNSTIAVFNPLNWKYSGLVDIYADYQIIPKNKRVRIVDEEGKEIRKQQIHSLNDAAYWRLWVENVPALGARTYQIIIEEQPIEAVDKKALSNELIENQWYRIKLNSQKGVIESLFDKELNKEILTPESTWKMGELIYETDDNRGALDRFTKGNFKRIAPESMRFEGHYEGDIWDTYRFKGTSAAGMGTDNLTVEFQLFKPSKEIKLVYRLKKKQETGPESVYVSFPFELSNGKIFFDVPGGVVEAGVDQIVGSSNDWNTVQNFASIRNEESQIVLVSHEVPLMQFGNINLGRFKAGAKPETNNIYSWPMTNYWVTNFNADQHGEFEWTYNLTSSTDNTVDYATKFAWGNRIPMLTRVIPAGKTIGKTSIDRASVLELDPAHTILVNMEDVPGENAVILHLRESAGVKGEIRAHSAFQKNIKLNSCNLFGESNGSPLTIQPWETKFVKLSW